MIFAELLHVLIRPFIRPKTKELNFSSSYHCIISLIESQNRYPGPRRRRQPRRDPAHLRRRGQGRDGAAHGEGVRQQLKAGGGGSGKQLSKRFL